MHMHTGRAQKCDAIGRKGKMNDKGMKGCNLNESDTRVKATCSGGPCLIMVRQQQERSGTRQAELRPSVQSSGLGYDFSGIVSSPPSSSTSSIPLGIKIG